MTKPKVSVVIPAKNEERFIGQCVRSVLACDYPRELLEVIVVDNGSSDRTVAIAQEAGARVVHKEGGRVGSVRNCGAQHAEGEVVAFLDADCTVGARWLSAAVEVLADPSVGAVGGVYLVDPSGHWVERVWVFGIVPRDQDVAALPGGSFILRRDEFLALGGFNEQITAGEDDELSNRIRRQGKRLSQRNDCAAVHWGYPNTLRAVMKRQIWIGSNQIQAAENWRDKSLLMTHAFALSLILLVLGLLSFDGALLGAGAVLALGVSGASAVRRNWEVLWSLPGVFETVRLSVFFLFFFLGRSVGLWKNYRTLLSGG